MNQQLFIRFNSTLSFAPVLLEKLMGGAVVVGVRCGVGGGIENRTNIKRNQSFTVITIEFSGNGLQRKYRNHPAKCILFASREFSLLLFSCLVFEFTEISSIAKERYRRIVWIESQTESNRTGGPKDSTSTKRRNVGKAKGSQSRRQQREEILRENFRDKPLVEFPFAGWNNHYVKHCTCTCIFYTCIFYGTRVDFRRWFGTSLKTNLLSKLSCYTLTSCLQQKECSDGTRNGEEEIGKLRYSSIIIVRSHVNYLHLIVYF